MSPADKRQRPDEASLDGELDALVEYLARRYHAGAGGSVVLWEQLPDAERKVFLSRARQTLVAIHAGGYRITHSPEVVDEGAPAGLASDPDALKLRIAEAEHFLHAGEPLLAFNEVQLGLESWPESVRLRQLQGLALARSGATRRANAVLQALADEGVSDGETLGLLARTHKDIGLSALDPRDKLVHLTAAFRIYDKAYRDSAERGRMEDAYYTGINAATLALLLNDEARSRRLATEVRALCLQELEKQVSDDAAYWLQATLGEAALILGELGHARSAYEQAAGLAGHRYGDLASTRRQAKLLLTHRGEHAEWLGAALATPPVLVFTGHMIDAPGRGTPRFPPELEERVAISVRDTIDSIQPLAAYGSAACGSDILCLEAVMELGGETHIVLPFPPAAFREVSVDFAGRGDWGRRFERVIEAAESVTVASDHRASGSVSAFEYANLILTGMGSLRAEGLGADVVGLAVWDGQPGDGGGGTGSAVELWRQRGYPVEHVHPGIPSGHEGAPLTSCAEDTGDGLPVNGFRHEIKAMLFADAVGYSKLTEDQIPIFISNFLGSVGRLSKRSDHRPIHSETAGDGLYMVFCSVADAGRYALALSELVHSVDWVGEGLPADLDLRIALHCGPIFCGTDPVTGRPLYTGPHTSRTARIEPITPPGQVYASGAFAAVAAAAGAEGFEFRYVGRTQLAKKYGSLPLFHVRSAAFPQTT